VIERMDRKATRRQRPAGEVVLVIALVLGSLAIGSRAVPAQTNASALARSEPRPAFPLRVEAGKRYLVDAVGKPFLIHGDTAWSLIADLTREDVERYLADRRDRGFNTLLVNLIETRFARNAPANAYGELPFQGQPFEAVAMLADLLPGHYGTTAANLVVDYTRPN
jgi:Protein of unknown function (DUF4038)